VSRRNEVVFGRPQRLKVFVSSEMRSGRLNDARQAVAEAIEESGFHDAWYWERDGHAGPFSSRPVCVGQAETSDYLILVLGEVLTDVTRDEYFAAKRAAAAVIIFVPVDCQRDAETEAFFQLEAATVTYGKFRSPADLRSRVLKALQAHAVRTLREHQLGRQLLVTETATQLAAGAANGEL